MSYFNPLVALNVLSNLLPPTERQGFRLKWKEEVKKRVMGWQRAGSLVSEGQLVYASEACQYIKYLYDKTLVNGNFSPNLPLYGPRFSPPPPALSHRNPNAASSIPPQDFYLKPITVVHELFWPSLMACPICAKAGRNEVKLERQGFTPEGPRTVHGIYEDEYVIGSRIRCKTCELDLKTRRVKGRFQWSFTAQEFWSGKLYWEIPREIPHFFQRTAISRDLFNLINEVRLSVPADRLREHVFQLHLLEYHQRRLQYLKLTAEKLGPSVARSATNQPRLDSFFAVPSSAVIEPFSEPFDPKGYNLTSISDEIITTVYRHFANTRTQESEQLMRGITCKVLSFDATYKATKKATISAGNATRQKTFETLVTMITEDNLIASWRFTFTETLLEIQAQLRDLCKRFDALGAPYPRQVIVDNCCTVRNKVQEVIPHTEVGLDVYHYSIRYTRTIKPSQSNSVSAVGNEIVSALLSETAATSATGRAQYRKKEEQAKLMEEFFRKWKARGVFTAAVDAVHEMGMKHIWKGCLERCVEDVRSDGSRIENTNRGWNGIARAIPGGLEGFLNQAHDWVLRRNIRLASSSKAATSIGNFVSTTFGSHHISLVSESTQLWNKIIEHKQLPYPLLATLRFADIDERFGLVHPIDGTFGVRSTEDIDYIGFEKTLLLEDIIKQEYDDTHQSLEDVESQVDTVGSLQQSHALSQPSVLTQPATLDQPKRSRSPEDLNPADLAENGTMELLPDGQDLEEYLQSEAGAPQCIEASASVLQPVSKPLSKIADPLPPINAVDYTTGSSTASIQNNAPSSLSKHTGKAWSSVSTHLEPCKYQKGHDPRECCGPISNCFIIPSLQYRPTLFSTTNCIAVNIYQKTTVPTGSWR
ncbi:hypothetical protein FRC04_009122 [Tulasnella sp. 424]|nr:hypothetical protein FRC04_009122 [Tulasnella sp. 424]